jgi:hypothetical protein
MVDMKMLAIVGEKAAPMADLLEGGVGKAKVIVVNVDVQ